MSSKFLMYNRPDDESFYRPQIFHYKYNTCIEKPRLLERYDPDTFKSLSSLMQSTKNLPVTKYNLPPINKTEPALKVAKSQSIICPQWLKFDKVVLKFKGYFNEHITVQLGKHLGELYFSLVRIDGDVFQRGDAGIGGKVGALLIGKCFYDGTVARLGDIIEQSVLTTDRKGFCEIGFHDIVWFQNLTNIVIFSKKTPAPRPHGAAPAFRRCG